MQAKPAQRHRLGLRGRCAAGPEPPRPGHPAPPSGPLAATLRHPLGSLGVRSPPPHPRREVGPCGEEAVPRGPARGEEEAGAEAAAGGGWQEPPVLKSCRGGSEPRADIAAAPAGRCWRWARTEPVLGACGGRGRRSEELWQRLRCERTPGGRWSPFPAVSTPGRGRGASRQSRVQRELRARGKRRLRSLAASVVHGLKIVSG